MLAKDPQMVNILQLVTILGLWNCSSILVL